MPLFGKSSKSPSEVVRSLKDSLGTLERLTDEGGKKFEKAQDDVSKYLVTISSLLFSCDTEQQSDIILAQMSQEMYNSQLIPALLRNLAKMEFEARKEVAEIFKHVLRRQIGTRTPTVEYICTNDEILPILCRGYQHPNISHNCGNMLRECLMYESLAKIVLMSDSFQDFFKFVEHPQFDIAADAFSSLRDLLTRHKIIVSDFIQTNYQDFFEKFNLLINSSNFVTKLNCLKLLNELLRDRSNLKVMKQYVSSDQNLKLVMNLMLDPIPAVRLTAFNIFKLFLMNPNKPASVVDILLINRDLLVTYLTRLEVKSGNDSQQSEINNVKMLLDKVKVNQDEE